MSIQQMCGQKSRNLELNGEVAEWAILALSCLRAGQYFLYSLCSGIFQAGVSGHRL